MRRSRVPLIFATTVALLLVTLVISVGMGAVSIPPRQVLAVLLQRSNPELSRTTVAIVWDLRLARTLLALVIGAGLAASGSAYQALFRNPLADPYIIGASGGAALGATLAIILNLNVVMPAAFVTALLAVTLVYFIAQAGGHVSSVSLVLAGVALSTLLSSAVSLLMFLGDRDLHEVFAWLLGGLSGRSWPQLQLAAPLIALGIVVLWSMSRPLDALTFGEETAQGLGLNLFRARALLVAAATLTTAASVASAGIIGFVGLLAPHIARRFVGGAHHLQIPMSVLVGALLLVLADDLARTMMAPLELPVGVLTALLGAPFFLWLLKRSETWPQ